MTITPEQLEARRFHIGSSDVGAILEVDPWRSPYDVYLEKIGEIDTQKHNTAIEAGNRLESAILDWASDKIGKPIVDRGVTVIHPLHPILATNLDGRVDAQMIVEGKSTGVAAEWGMEEGTDIVPERVLAQTHHAMLCTGARIALVPVLMGAFGINLKLFRVEFNDGLGDIILEKCLDFWQNHIVPRVPPSDCRPSLDTLKRIRREPEKTVPISDEVADRFVKARDLAKAANDALELAKIDVITSLGDAEVGICSSGQVSYSETKRKEYVVAASTYRVLRWKGKK